MTKNERQSRIIARGEFSNHSHVVVGGAATVEKNDKGEILIKLDGSENAGDVILRHILESDWLAGKETWTGEHHDVNLSEIDSKIEIGQVGVRHGDVALEKVAEGTYKYVPQMEFDPFENAIRQVMD